MKKYSNDVPATPSAQSLRVEKGETVALAPESLRFKDCFRRVRPRSAKELRQLVGLSDDMAKTFKDRGVCCHQPGPSVIVSAEELNSSDEAVRGRAIAATEKALLDYVVAVTPASFVQMEPSIALYLETANVVLHVAALQDIEVADGAALTISANTHLVEANKIILHGSARIDCAGFTKFKVTSIEKA